MGKDAYAAAGVDTGEADAGLSGLVAALNSIDPGRPKRSIVDSGHYASVLKLDEQTAIAIGTDGVGTKLIVAELAGRYDTVGIDCVAMCVNDLICVGAEPLAMLDYLAVEQADPAVLTELGAGLKQGAELAGIEIPGGELAQLPEMIKGHPSPTGLDLVGAAFGTVAPDALVLGDRIEVSDIVIGLPSSGLHSNGFTLARRVLLDEAGLKLDGVPDAIGRPLADELLEPTEIYVRAVLELLQSTVDVRGLAHITGDGLLNLLRLNDSVGFEIDDPPVVPAIFSLIADEGDIGPAEMHQVFNMGTGFCCVVAAGDEQAALDLLRKHYPSAQRIGRITGQAGKVSVPPLGLTGTRDGMR